MLGRLLVDLWKQGVAKTLGLERETAGGDTRIVSLGDMNSLVKARHGWFLANRYDKYLGRALMLYGEYSEIEQAFLRSLLKPGGHVIEVGANIGSHTVGLAKTVGPDGVVFAIEPQPAIFRVLCANLALNGLNHVIPLAVGCAAQRGRMNVPFPDYSAAVEHNSGGVALDVTSNGVPVDVVPLDELVGADMVVQLLKVDVEGMELDTLQGGRSLIERHRPLLYVENDRVEKSRELIEWILAAGYRLWWHAPPLFNPNNFFGLKDNLYGRTISLNMLAVPKGTTLAATATLQEVTDPGYHPLNR